MSDIQVILGNSNSRYSGVTSTMLATLPGIAAQVEVAVLGRHFVPSGYRVLGWWQFIQLVRRPRSDGRRRVFHARRNDEMIQALLAKWLFGGQHRIVFTSTAQRHHSRFTKWLMRQMDDVITTCHAANSYLSPPAQTIIPHGVDVTEFTPAPDRAALWQSLGHGGDYGIGIFGRVRPSKGIDLLVRAAIPLLQHDPRPTIIIIGETTPKFAPYQAELQADIDAAGLTDRILFLGKLPFADVQRHFQAVSLVTALSRNEGFGLTVLEALASGTAVLASTAGAWADILAPGIGGRLVDPLDHDTLQQALRNILQDPAHLHHLGQEGRTHVTQHHPVTQEVTQLTQYYASLY